MRTKGHQFYVFIAWHCLSSTMGRAGSDGAARRHAQSSVAFIAVQPTSTESTKTCFCLRDSPRTGECCTHATFLRFVASLFAGSPGPIASAIARFAEPFVLKHWANAFSRWITGNLISITVYHCSFVRFASERWLSMRNPKRS